VENQGSISRIFTVNGRKLQAQRNTRLSTAKCSELSCVLLSVMTVQTLLSIQVIKLHRQTVRVYTTLVPLQQQKLRVIDMCLGT